MFLQSRERRVLANSYGEWRIPTTTRIRFVFIPTSLANISPTASQSMFLVLGLPPRLCFCTFNWCVTLAKTQLIDLFSYHFISRCISVLKAETSDRYNAELAMGRPRSNGTKAGIGRTSFTQPWSSLLDLAAYYQSKFFETQLDYKYNLTIIVINNISMKLQSSSCQTWVTPPLPFLTCILTCH